MPEKSLIDCAFDVLNAEKKPLPFKDLFDKVVAMNGLKLSNDGVRSNMSKLYTELTVDNRFYNLEGNCWDLRSRYKFDQYYVNTDDIIVSDDDSDDGEDFDREEQRLQEEELGEEVDEALEDESDDLDFDSKKDSSDSEEEF